MREVTVKIKSRACSNPEREELNYGSACSGIGGFEIGFDKCGWRCEWQIEKDKQCLHVLEKHWPEVPKYEDLTKFTEYDLEPVELICAGDPCPCRSIARRGRKSKHPDLAGYVLALAGRLRPQWMVHENVPAPDVSHFALALECLGYTVLVVRLQGQDFAASLRGRDFVVGCLDAGRAAKFESLVRQREVHGGDDSESGQNPKAVLSLLTSAGACGAKNYSADNSYIFEDGIGIRVLSPEEAERAMGFPAGWTTGLARTTRGRLIGNAVMPPMAEWLAERIGR